MSKAHKALAVLAATMLAAVGCGDSTTTPTAPTALSLNAGRANGLVDGLLGTVTELLVPPVKRTTPLASDVSWTFVAGPGGAVSKNSAVGLTISIPSGALAATTTIKVTALAGSAVAYSFEPHLEFAKPVTLTQSLKGTSAGGLLSLPLVSGAHFEGDQLTLSGGLAVVNEVVPALANIFTQTASFNVGHFSGWILASGRCDAE